MNEEQQERNLRTESEILMVSGILDSIGSETEGKASAVLQAINPDDGIDNAIEAFKDENILSVLQDNGIDTDELTQGLELAKLTFDAAMNLRETAAALVHKYNTLANGEIEDEVEVEFDLESAIDRIYEIAQDPREELAL